MPLYRCTIYKSLLSDESNAWSNVYTIEAADETDALNLGENIMDIERLVHKSNVVFTRIAVRQPGPLSGSGRQRALSGAVGDVAAVPANQLPNFNTVRVVFSDELGRSESKYLRPPLENTEVTGSFLDVGTVAAFGVTYGDAIVALGYVRGPQGENLTGSTAQEAIQMRQRGWSRRTRPGFKRGWVPV